MNTCKKPVRNVGRIFVLFAFILAVTAIDVAAETKDKEFWDKKYDVEKFVFGKKPLPFIENNIKLLPKGKALDIAMGEGRNGVYLAMQGFDVLGVDISEVGLNKARNLATESKTKISTQVVDLETYQLEKNAYDVILLTYYTQKNLFPRIKESLKSGGMVVAETFTMDHLRHRPDFIKAYLLETNEFLEAFKDLKIIRYQLVDDGKQVYASIIAQKP